MDEEGLFVGLPFVLTVMMYDICLRNILCAPISEHANWKAAHYYLVGIKWLCINSRTLESIIKLYVALAEYQEIAP
jgi:hypothetical protein